MIPRGATDRANVLTMCVCLEGLRVIWRELSCLLSVRWMVSAGGRDPYDGIASRHDVSASHDSSMQRGVGNTQIDAIYNTVSPLRPAAGRSLHHHSYCYIAIATSLSLSLKDRLAWQ